MNSENQKDKYYIEYNLNDTLLNTGPFESFLEAFQTLNLLLKKDKVQDKIIQSVIYKNKKQSIVLKQNLRFIAKEKQ